jgi:hypothetical protein
VAFGTKTYKLNLENAFNKSFRWLVGWLVGWLVPTYLPLCGVFWTIVILCDVEYTEPKPVDIRKKERERLKKSPWLESASELYRPSDRRLSAKLAPTLADRGCHVVSETDPYGRILEFLDRSSYVFFQVAPQLYSRG